MDGIPTITIDFDQKCKWCGKKGFRFYAKDSFRERFLNGKKRGLFSLAFDREMAIRRKVEWNLNSC